MNINKTRTITSFINSANRQTHEDISSFTVDYQDGILLCNPNEYIEINVLSFDMQNTMYNINDNNNKFIFISIIDDITNIKNCIIPYGNYSIKTFMSKLKELININDINISYNEAQNTYTFNKIVSSNIYKIQSININNVIGILNNTEYEITVNGFNTGLINLINYNKVIIKVDNISFYYSNVENIRTVQNQNNVFLNNIIFWKSKADIPPFKNLQYNNEDGGNSFVYKVENKQINSIVFKLINEYNELLTDTQDYTMTIQYNFYEKQDIYFILLSIHNTIKELFDMLLFVINRMRLLL